MCNLCLKYVFKNEFQASPLSSDFVKLIKIFNFFLTIFCEMANIHQPQAPFKIA